MHAALPCFSREINQVMRIGAEHAAIPARLDGVAGKILAQGIALLLKFGFGYVMRDSLIDEERARESMEFFDENFVLDDPRVQGGRRYYQGKFLIRTSKPGDDMNVWLRFCPKPDELYVDTPLGEVLNSLAVVSTEVIDEAEADRLEKDPDSVDLVIRFKDIGTILGLIGRPDVDIVALLLENVVRVTGNVGHLFKLGAIARNVELAVG